MVTLAQKTKTVNYTVASFIYNLDVSDGYRGVCIFVEIHGAVQLRFWVLHHMIIILYFTIYKKREIMDTTELCQLYRTHK